MNINRRQFIQLISSGAAAAYTMDLDKLLWVPGEKTIFIPPPRQLIWASQIHKEELSATLEIIKSLPKSDKFLYETIVTDNLVQIYYGYVNEIRNP